MNILKEPIKITDICFSPTNGVRAVLDIMENYFINQHNITNNNINRIDLSDRTIDFKNVKQIEKDSLCFIGVPVYYGRVEKTAAKRLANIKADNSPAVIVAVYGNRSFSDALVELSDIASSCGFNIIAAVAASAEHSLLRQYGKGRPDELDKNEIEEFLVRVQSKLCSEKNSSISFTMPGDRPYRNYGKSTIFPLTSEACTQCALCYVKCPVGAISTKDYSIIDKDICISCMRCISVCPYNAKYVSTNQLQALDNSLGPSLALRKQNHFFI